MGRHYICQCRRPGVHFTTITVVIALGAGVGVVCRGMTDVRRTCDVYISNSIGSNFLPMFCIYGGVLIDKKKDRNLPKF